jgi:hypothetical protein
VDIPGSGDFTTVVGISTSSPSRARHASRSSPSAYRIRSWARRPGGPKRLRATTASVRWPTMSRPRRIHDRRASSSRMPADSATAPATPSGSPGASRRISKPSDRRACAARRCNRSATCGARSDRPSRAGRSMTRTSTARPPSNAPAIDSPSSRSAGVTMTSHSSRTPRATASTGSNVPPTSTHAAIDPAAWASATVRNARVVLPLEPAPRNATPAARGNPPGPRIASSVGKPVDTTVASGTERGSGRSSTTSKGNGAVASAPTTPPTAVASAAPTT